MYQLGTLIACQKAYTAAIVQHMQRVIPENRLARAMLRDTLCHEVYMWFQDTDFTGNKSACSSFKDDLPPETVYRKKKTRKSYRIPVAQALQAIAQTPSTTSRSTTSPSTTSPSTTSRGTTSSSTNSPNTNNLNTDNVRTGSLSSPASFAIYPPRTLTRGSTASATETAFSFSFEQLLETAFAFALTALFV